MKTHPSKREKQILTQVQQKGSVPIKELVETLNVSAMTVHRDLNKLVDEGLVVKSHGAVSLPRSPHNPDNCAMCGKSVSERTVFLLSMKNGEQHRGCCAHCGLMLHEHLKNVWQAMTPDFLRGHMLTANQAFYVVQSELNICCMPSILSFGLKEDAEKFSKGFGGHIADMQDAIHILQEMMHAHPDMPAHPRK